MAHEYTSATVKHFHHTPSATSLVSHRPLTYARSLHFARYLTAILTGFFSVLLGIRLVILLFGLQAASSFTRFVTTITQPLSAPFSGLVPDSTYGAMNGGKIESATILVMIAIAFLGFAIRQLLDVLEPKPLILEDPQL